MPSASPQHVRAQLVGGTRLLHPDGLATVVVVMGVEIVVMAMAEAVVEAEAVEDVVAVARQNQVHEE